MRNTVGPQGDACASKKFRVCVHVFLTGSVLFCGINVSEHWCEHIIKLTKHLIIKCAVKFYFILKFINAIVFCCLVLTLDLQMCFFVRCVPLQGTFTSVWLYSLLF